MKDKNIENKNWSVYEHVFPNGYRYIGITCNKPERRWKKGRGYIRTAVGSAIEEYGWDKIKHNIIETGLSEFEAKCLEEYYICSYRTYIGFSDCKGYNMTLGGDNIISEESRRKISEALKGKTSWNKGKHFSPETCKKISESKKGKPSPKKGKKTGKPSWNRGIPQSEEAKRKQSEAMKGKMSGEKNPMYGKHRTEEFKKRHSEVMKGKMSGEKNPMYGTISPVRGKHRVYNEDGTWHME